MPLNVDKISTGSLSVNGTEINKNGGLPYKVYTALLTQSGNGNTTGISSGPLTKGITYKIQVDGGDFANVGAPNNNANTYFVATESITPTSYGGNELLYNTGAPVVTVLENTIGNIYWTYQGAGQYSASVPNFIQGKGLVFYGAGNIGNYSYVVQAYNDVPSSGIWIDTSDSSIGSSVDGVLQETPIEIRVYN